MTREELQSLLQPVWDRLGDRPVNAELGALLNQQFPANSAVFQKIEQACHKAIADGWMCQYEAGGIRYGRVIKPSAETGGFSVDVVRMQDIKGPHHRHPNGEIDMIMPLTEGAKFDGHGAGWLVYPADSAHYPTVIDGEALVLYLLPDGAIEFTQAS